MASMFFIVWTFGHRLASLRRSPSDRMTTAARARSWRVGCGVARQHVAAAPAGDGHRVGFLHPRREHGVGVVMAGRRGDAN